MQKLQDSVFSIVKTTSLSPAVFSFLQPTDDFDDKTPLGGILKDTKHGWLALGPKFCVVDLRTGLKVAARTFGAMSNTHISVTSVVELPTPLTENSQQLIISLQCEDVGLICILHINGSQILRCIQTEVVVTELAVSDVVPDGPFTCFDGIIIAGTRSGELFVFDLNRTCLIQALKDISQGYEHLIQGESNPANLHFLPLNAIQHIEEQRDIALDNDGHLAVLLNESSLVDNQYIFRNPDGTVRMKAKRDHIRVTVLEYIPQLGSLAVGYNFGAFQIWNLMNLDLEFTSQVNVECLPVTHFGFQEPCDDPRAFCYLWVVFSVIDRFEEEEFPLAVMYSLTYQGKRMLSDTKCLYQEFSSATIRFQVELSAADGTAMLGGKCVSCHTYSINSTLGADSEDSMLNICQLVWECWGEDANSSSQYGMLLFDLDQWYKDQMPATYRVQSTAFMSATWCREAAGGPRRATLAARLEPASLCVYSHATRLEEHFYPNSLQYNCICLNTSESSTLSTIGIQRQIISSIDEVGPTALLNPPRLYNACVAAGLTPLYMNTYGSNPSPEEQRRFLLSVALEARLSRFLKRCAHDWATGSHVGAGCTLTFLVDWCWKRAIDLKENARELTAPLFASSTLPDRNVVRCLEHCVQQLTQLTGLLDAVLTKCCNLVVPDALSEMEEKFKGIGTVALYFQVVQWFLRVGLLPERHDAYTALPYPTEQLNATYSKRRLKLNRLQDNAPPDDMDANKSCSLLYIDQLIEQEFGGERIHQMWIKGGSECSGLYPPPSLYSLLRLYLLPDIAEEHKHSLVLYLLVDYSMVYDEVRYEAVIRRLMQFPTMFGLSNTAIKATQAFWHLDHRDFDFALDQLQCLTGNTLSEWQHNVVLSSLLAQKKTQAALQYLHVRKPAPIQNLMRDKDGDISSYNNKVNDHDKLDDWQSCCNLYLARGLVFEALDVIRMCVKNASSIDDKVQVLNFYFKGCRNTGHLSKILQISLLSFEEEVFIRYLENCNESQTSDILIMYYLQQARYLEAERYNAKLKQSKPRTKDISTSIESLADVLDREGARETIVEVVCAAIPNIANTVAHYAMGERDLETHVIAPKPMSVYVQAKSPKNMFTYKSSFIQDTIENASETWMNKPKTRRGIKRALNIEDTPFICTPKLSRTKSLLSAERSPSQSSPPKRARLSGAAQGAQGGQAGQAARVSAAVARQLAALLAMPPAHSPPARAHNDTDLYDRSGADTPHSILKRREALSRDAPSPVDSRYLCDSDDDIMETASNHTHYSDSTNKHLRFTIPTASESGSTPSPPSAAVLKALERERERSLSQARKKEIGISIVSEEKEMDTTMAGESGMDVTTDSFVTTTSHAMNEPHPFESPPKKQATEKRVIMRKSYKDTVRARRSLSISANSSLSDDPNTSIESIADIPITLINPRYSGERRQKNIDTLLHLIDNQSVVESGNKSEIEIIDSDETSKKETGIVGEMTLVVPQTPKGRRGIRSLGESTPLANRSRSVTPDCQGSPVVTPLHSIRITRSRSRTPELSPRSSPLDPIPEQPKQEVECEPHPERTMLSVPRLRSRSRTPDRVDKSVKESPRLAVITESPAMSTGSNSSSSSSRRSLRSHSQNPEVEMLQEQTAVRASPSGSKSRSRTPDRVDKAVKESPLAVISESSTTSTDTNSTSSSPSRRSLRSHSRTPEVESLQEQTAGDASPSGSKSRSRTPDRVEKTPKESSLAVITESPTTSTDTNSSSSSPSRRSLRSRSRTPEIESLQETAVKSSPSGLKSRSKTPEKIMSPKRDLGRSQKSLSRMVLEMNAFAKNKQPENTETTDSAIECTPMKSYKQVPSLMDVTLSPIVNKSILQSSTDSVQSDSDNKLVDTSTTELGIKPLPAFTTMHETYVEKSVLRSYESSVETSQGIQDTNTADNDSNVLVLPAFTTINETGFDKSVLHSYESSVAESSSVFVETETQTEKVSKPFAAFAAMIATDFEKSVLRSHQSSMAESSQDVDITDDKSSLNASIMTNDSDLEIKKRLWQVEHSAAVIQKEKEKIVEIEREINEIEGDMSDDAAESASSGDEEIVEGAEESESESSDESSTSESEEEIISINDTDSEDSTSGDNRLVIDNQSPQPPEPTEHNIETVMEVQVEKVEENRPPEMEVTTDASVTIEDPLNHGLSILTDDNSMVESDKSEVNLNYSDEKENRDKESEQEDEVPTETDIEATPVVQINVVLEEVAAEETIPMEISNVAQEIDVVDSIQPVDVVVVEIQETIIEKEDKPPTNIPEENVMEAEQTFIEKDVNPQAEVKDAEKIPSNICEENVMHVEETFIEKDVTPQAEVKDAEEITSNVSEENRMQVEEILVEKDVNPQQEKIPSNISEENQVQVEETFIEKVVNPQPEVKDAEKIPSNIVEENVKQVEETFIEKVVNQQPEGKDAEKIPSNIVEENVKQVEETFIEKDFKPQAEIKDAMCIASKIPEENVMQVEETKITEKVDEVTKQIEKDVEKPAARIRKRIKSTTIEPETEVMEVKTPITRKRTQSNASNKSVTETEQITPENKTETRKRTQSSASKPVVEPEEKTPENKSDTPTRRRAKTPTSGEVRKIITRRMSRELSEKLDESENLEELTPKRRSARSRSKNIDDNESVASESSVLSTRSKANEDVEVKPAPIRKGRRSILVTKPDLSVIPEAISEEGAKGDSAVVGVYSSPRSSSRLQKPLPETWLEPSVVLRRTSVASRTSTASKQSHDDDDDSRQSFDVQPIDRISLLNKTDFEGPPDTEELQNFSPESIASEASKQRKSRVARATSEARVTPKAARITRRVSVEVDNAAEPSPPGSSGDPPTRGRRASFNRACEALHTPKGRRPSTDLRRGEVESPVDSPAGSESESMATPSRRPRRTSTQSNTSVTRSESGKRTKKMAVIEESKDTKKK